jgi:hypothetical protein
LDHPAVELTECPISLLAVVAPLVHGLDEMADKDADRVDKVDAVLEDIGSALRLVPSS